MFKIQNITYVKFSENLLIKFRELTENWSWPTNPLLIDWAFLPKNTNPSAVTYRSIMLDLELFTCLDREAFQLVCRSYTLHTTHYSKNPHKRTTIFRDQAGKGS